MYQQHIAQAFIDAAKRDGLPIITVAIPFRNNDVPEYLENLRRFEEESRKANIVIGKRK
jgi:hypothetical protein